jgi:translation initiation factor 3 subunit C
MSRFFRAGDDSSSESSSDEEELYSEEEAAEAHEEEESDEAEGEEEGSSDESSDDEDDKKKGASRFFVDVSSESEESDTEATTKVKSAKDKRFEELDATINAITNGQKNGDWGLISTGQSLVTRPSMGPCLLTETQSLTN